MRSVWISVLACAAAIALGGCEEARRALGQEKSAPDEFAVYSRAPLSLPPDYGLRPPAPGTARPQSVNPRDNAERAILGKASTEPGQSTGVAPADASPGLLILLRQTGALNADPGIRAAVNQETTGLTEDSRSMAERLIFWGKTKEYSTAVDPQKESRRISENQALGRPITEGETPIIERKRF